MYCTHTAVLGLYGRLHIVHRDVAVLAFGIMIDDSMIDDYYTCVLTYVCVCALSPQYWSTKVRLGILSRKVHEAIVVWSLAMLDQRIQKQALSAGQGKEKNTKWSTVEMGWPAQQRPGWDTNWQQLVQDRATRSHLCTNQGDQAATRSYPTPLTVQV